MLIKDYLFNTHSFSQPMPDLIYPVPGWLQTSSHQWLLCLPWLGIRTGMDDDTLVCAHGAAVGSRTHVFDSRNLSTGQRPSLTTLSCDKTLNMIRVWQQLQSKNTCPVFFLPIKSCVHFLILFAAAFVHPLLSCWGPSLAVCDNWGGRNYCWTDKLCRDNLA